MGDDRLFLTILRGPSPRDAHPVVATEDQEIIRKVARALTRRLELSELKTEGELELVRSDDGEADSAP